MAVRRPLDQRILAVLKEAVVQDRLDVAEHLLQALEALEGEPRPGSSLGDACLLMPGREGGGGIRRKPPDHQAPLTLPLDQGRFATTDLRTSP